MAAYMGRVRVIRRCLDAKFDLKTTNEDGKILLHEAARGGCLQVVTMLVLEDPSTVNIIDTRGGWTALHLASFYGFLPIVTFLVEHGANPAICDKNKNTANTVAANAKRDNIVAYLTKINNKN